MKRPFAAHCSVSFNTLRLLAIALCSVCCNFIAAQTYTLQQLKDSALHNNIAIRNARLDIEAAQQQRK